MTVKQRIEKLEEKPENRQTLLLVAPNDDGTFSDMHGRKYTTTDLAAYGSRVLIFEPHKPKDKSHEI